MYYKNDKIVFRDLDLFLDAANEAAMEFSAHVVRRALHHYLRTEAATWYLGILS